MRKANDGAERLSGCYRPHSAPLLVCVAALLLAALAAAGAQRSGAGKTAEGGTSLVNKRAPEFELRDLNGQMLDLARYRGKVVLLNFWATWCAPCQIEMPTFSRWQSQYGSQGLQIIGISMDDDAAPARKLVNRMKLTYPVAMGDARLGRRYGGVLGLPLTLLIDRSGVVRARFQGETDSTAIEQQMKVLLKRQ